MDSLDRIEPFPIGAHDIPERLVIPEKLYGRDAEREALLSAFARVVASGRPRIVACVRLFRHRQILCRQPDPARFPHLFIGRKPCCIEGRELDAMRLYEKAIRAAREQGFVQNEGIGNELAAKFYLDRGFETIAQALSSKRALLLSSLGSTGQGAAA